MRMRRVLTAMIVAIVSTGLLGLPPAAAHDGPHVPGDNDPAARGVVVAPGTQIVPVIEAQTGGWFVLSPCLKPYFVTEGRYYRNFDVVLDPGHGGSESGAVGSNGLVERDLNLAVARQVKAILQSRGIRTLLTRETDTRIPLRTRAEIANAVAPDLFISIHHNGGARRFSSTPGTETFYQVNNAESRRFALLAYDRLSAAMARFGSSFVDTVRQGANARLRTSGDDLYGILRYSAGLHSVITEALYLSNPAEARLLARADVQYAEALAIADSVSAWYADPAATGRGDNGSFVNEATSGTGGFEGCRDPYLGPTTPVGTGYNAEDYAELQSAAAYLGMDVATFQKTGVYVVDFLRKIGNRTGREPLLDEEKPYTDGPNAVVADWTAAERGVLAHIAYTYAVDQPGANKIGAAALTFLVGVDRANSGR